MIPLCLKYCKLLQYRYSRYISRENLTGHIVTFIGVSHWRYLTNI